MEIHGGRDQSSCPKDSSNSTLRRKSSKRVAPQRGLFFASGRKQNVKAEAKSNGRQGGVRRRSFWDRRGLVSRRVTGHTPTSSFSAGALVRRGDNGACPSRGTRPSRKVAWARIPLRVGWAWVPTKRAVESSGSRASLAGRRSSAIPASGSGLAPGRPTVCGFISRKRWVTPLSHSGF